MRLSTLKCLQLKFYNKVSGVINQILLCSLWVLRLKVTYTKFVFLIKCNFYYNIYVFSALWGLYVFKKIKNEKILITGGAGFIGLML
jgi:hypothetical protein